MQSNIHEQMQEANLSNQVDTSIGQAHKSKYQGNRIFRRSPLFKDRSDINHKVKMVKRRIKTNLLIAKAKGVARTMPEKQGMHKIREKSSLADSMPQAPHNTTQYITQTTQPNSFFFLEQSAVDDSYDGVCSFENHSMLGSMRDMVIGNNSFFEKDMSITSEEAKKEDQHIMHIEDSKQGAKPTMDLAYTTPIYLSDLFKKAQSSPNETEKVLEYLANQVKVRDDIICRIEIKQQT